MNGSQFLIFSNKKTFTVAPVFNKPNDRIVTFGNDASEYCRVPITKCLASMMMLAIVVSNREKIHWFELNLCHHTKKF